MRERADAERIHQFLRQLGRRTSIEATIYLAGGATAVLHGWRQTTIDIDLRLEPDADELLRTIAVLKEELKTNVELASPFDFIPELRSEERRVGKECRSGGSPYDQKRK